MSVLSPAHEFGAEALEGLPGPAWLAERRRLAAGRFLASATPTGFEEHWRYGRIQDLDLGRFAPLGAGDPGRLEGAGAESLPAEVGRFLELIGDRSALVVARDGVVVRLELEPGVAASGVALSRLAESEEPPAGFGELLAGVAEPYPLLAEAFVADGAVLRIPDRVRVPSPIVLVHLSSAAAEGRAVFPRTQVSWGEQAEATVVELVVSGDEPQLVVPVTELELAEGAQATYLSAQELGTSAWHLGYQLSRLGRSSRLSSFVAAFGGDYARHWSRTDLAGEGAESELRAVYLGDGNQVEEFRTFQEHAAPRTRSELVFKGAVAGSARSVYTGLIHMHPGARKADASQTNRNLVLSEGAQAYSVPNLDIEENDVRCSHASAVGPVDPAQRFYLESRGVPTEVAQRLILLGFFEDLFARAPSPGFAEHLRSVTAGRLVPEGREAEVLAAARSAR